MKRRYESDINRIFSLIYEDEPVPPRVNTGRPEIPVPQYVRPERSAKKERRKTFAPDMPSLRKEKRKSFALDTGSLEGIRKAAGRTMEKLLTDEELDFSEAVSADEAAGSEDLLSAEENEIPFGLTEQENALLRALLKNEKPEDVIPKGSLLSVIVDSINEKLFDEFGDTVLENLASPQLIEDYKEELKALFPARGH